MKEKAVLLSKKNSFIGWIPCVIGHLDFSKITTKYLDSFSDQLHSFPICFSYTDQHSPPTIPMKTRINIASSVFNWKDRKDTEELYDGLFRFITIASIDNYIMNGKAYLLLDSDVHETSTFVNEILNPLKEIELSVKKYENAIAEDQYSPSDKLESASVESKVTVIEDAIDRFSKNELYGRILTIKYTVLENGLVFLQPVKRVGIDDKEGDIIKIEHSQFIAAKQTFIYLKSCFHTHKHHNVQEDRLTSIHPICVDNITASAHLLISDLQHSIIEIKDRECNSLDSPHHFLQGFTSYAKSLVEALLEVGFIVDKEAIHKKVFFDNMLQSWRSLILKSDIERGRLEEYKKNKSDANNETLQALSILVAVFSIMFTGISQAFNNNDITSAINETFYEFLLPLFDNPVNNLNMFSIFGGGLLIILTWKILSNPYWYFRRFSSYCFGYIEKKYILRCIRGLILLILGATFSIYLDWLIM